MGPSGAGKSTLLSIIGMLDGAWLGKNYFNDEPFQKLNFKNRNNFKKTNFVFFLKTSPLFKNLIFFKNLESPLSKKNVPKKNRVSRFGDARDRLNIVGK